METFKSILAIVIFIGFMYHLMSYRKTDETPYHGIMAIIYMLVLLL